MWRITIAMCHPKSTNLFGHVIKGAQYLGPSKLITCVIHMRRQHTFHPGLKTYIKTAESFTHRVVLVPSMPHNITGSLGASLSFSRRISAARKINSHTLQTNSHKADFLFIPCWGAFILLLLCVCERAALITPNISCRARRAAPWKQLVCFLIN